MDRTNEQPPWAKRMTNPNDVSSPYHSHHLISTNGKKAQRIWYSGDPLFESTQSELKTLWHQEPFEQCGFITNESHTVCPVRNAHQEPYNNYFMATNHAQQVIDVIYQEMHEEILGIYHTHPNNIPWPSPRDIVGWPDPRLEFRYFIILDGDVTEWELV